MKQYKHKLNMLEPGSKMIKIIGVLLLSGYALYKFKLFLLTYVFIGIAVLISLILFILLIIEQHQDKVMNEQYIRERRKLGDD